MKRAKHAEWALLSAIVVAGALLRYIAQTHLTAISPDGVAYIFHALGVSQGVGSLEMRGPLFQLLLIFIYRIVGANFQSSVIFPMFFGSILPVIFFFVGRHFFDSKTGLVAALLCSINPMAINLSCWVLRESLSLCLILALIFAADYTLKIRPERKSLLATILPAFLSGLTILTREEMLFVIPLAYVAYVFFNEEKHRDFLIRIFVFLTVAVLTITPWLLYSNIHFGNPFYSYTYYVEVSIQKGSRYTLAILSDVLLGLWKEINVLPQILSLLGLVFLGIGIMFTIRRRDIWMIYSLMAFDLLVLSKTFGSSTKMYFIPLPYEWGSINRIPFPAIFPASLIAAYGVRSFFSSLLNLEKEKIMPLTLDRTKVKLPKSRLSRVTVLLALGLLVLGAIQYLPTYPLLLKDFDKTSSSAFVESAEFLNSSGNEAGVFTMQPEILQRYYKGPIYKLPEKATFENILEEAKRREITYLIIESTCVSSRELIELYYHSVDASWSQIPSEFVLVKSREWDYGIYYLQT